MRVLRLCVGGAVGLILGGIVLKQVAQSRKQVAQSENNPQTFLACGRKPSTQTVVVCVGDSITHGVVSANYVEMLQQQLGLEGYEFINAGVDGNLAWNIVQRLDDIADCQPDVVTILVGTNDVNATFSQKWENTYHKQQQITQKPTAAWYRENVEQIIERLQLRTKARILLLEIPVLGENLDSEINKKVQAYNTLLKEIAIEKQITLLPLNERLRAVLPPNNSASRYTGKLNLAYMAIFKRLVLRKSWNDISRSHKLYLLTDHIHLNERAAGIIVELISTFLKTSRENSEPNMRAVYAEAKNLTA